MERHLCKWLYPSGTVAQHTALNVKTEVQNPLLALTERKWQSTCVNGCIPVGQWYNTQLIILRLRLKLCHWHWEKENGKDCRWLFSSSTVVEHSTHNL
jgi:hypothetical protein